MKANDRREKILKELLGTNYEAITLEDEIEDRFAVTVRDKTTKKTVTEVVSGSGFIEDAVLSSIQHCIYRLEHPDEPQGHFVKDKFVYNDLKDEEKIQREIKYFDKLKTLNRPIGHFEKNKYVFNDPEEQKQFEYFEKMAVEREGETK